MHMHEIYKHDKDWYGKLYRMLQVHVYMYVI